MDNQIPSLIKGTTDHPSIEGITQSAIAKLREFKEATEAAEKAITHLEKLTGWQIKVDIITNGNTI